MELWILIKREYRERVRNKTFVISTILGLVIIIGLSFAPVIMDKIRSSDRTQITILAENSLVKEYLEDQLQDKLPNGELELTFKAVVSNPADWSAYKKELLEQLVGGKISAVLEYAPPDAPGNIIWHSKKIDLGGASNKVRSALQQLATQKRIEQSGLSSNQLNAIFTPINFVIQTEGLKAATQEQQRQNMTLVYFLLFMLYFSLMGYGMYVANGVIEEKSNRIMEMMIATVRPITMMTAKILGVGAIGLTQYFIWTGAGFLLLFIKNKDISLVPGMAINLSTIEPVYLFYLVLFFILGFLLYASLYAGIGAMVSRVEDTQQAVGPMTFLIVISLMLAMFTLYNPDNPWIVALSYVPFFTPMLLFARLVLTQIPTFYVFMGILDLLISIVIFIWIAGRLYRNGVLMYGKVSWRDMFSSLKEG